MMQNLPLVSVVIPTYNRADLLPRAIESVLAQSYRPIEIIVVDDGSTDNTKTELEVFEGRIRYLASGHKGAAHARNVGMQAASGKYLAFLDSDDMYLPYKIELQVEFAEQHPDVGMVCTEFSGTYPDNRFDERLMRNYHIGWKEKSWTYEDVFSEHGILASKCIEKPINYYIGDIFKFVIQNSLIPSNTIFFCKDILDIVGYQNIAYRFAQEYDFVVRICKHFKVAFLDIPTYLLTFHPNQATAFYEKTVKTKEEIVWEIDTWNVQLNVLRDYGFNDSRFYAANKTLVNEIFADIYYNIGKCWLRFGDAGKAKGFFENSFRLHKGNRKLFFYWIMTWLPDKARALLIKISLTWYKRFLT